MISKAFGLEAEIEPYAEYRCDRTLDSSRFRIATGWQPPSWDAMIEKLAADRTPYDQWRQA
jgi:dTDP-4-dehydrorhamnose reductase